MSGIAVGALAIGTGYQMYKGHKTKKEGKDILKDLERPEYEVNQNIKDNVAIAQNLANEGISAQERNAYLDDVATNSANTVASMRSRKAGIIGAEVAGRQTQKSYTDLLVESTKKRLENQRLLMRQKERLAGEEMTAFEYNEANSYAENLNYGRSRVGAGEQTMNDAMQNLASSGVSYGVAREQGKTAPPTEGDS